MSIPNNTHTPSTTTQSLVELLLQRDQAGQRKYGTTLDRIDLGAEDWAQHAIEEALDMAGYLRRFASTVGELRAENLRLAEENVRMRAMLAPILELARTLDIEPSTPAMPVVVEVDAVEVDVVEDSVHNILTDDKILCPVPTVSEPLGLTSREIAQALGYHKDSVNNWGRAGLLPEPVSGTGAHPHNPARYVVDLEELRAKVEARQAAAKTVGLAKPAGETMTWDAAAKRLGITRESVRLYIKRGFLEGGAGLVTVASVDVYQQERLKPGQRRDRVLTDLTPTPRDEEISIDLMPTAGISHLDVEPRPAPQLSEATKHDYHWRNALPVLEAGIAKAEAEGEACIEVAYQTTPDNYQNRGAFVVRPFGQLGPGLMAFVRATQESGKWSVTIPLRVESWIRPMAEGLQNHWRDLSKVRDVAATPRPQSSASVTRSLQA